MLKLTVILPWGSTLGNTWRIIDCHTTFSMSFTLTAAVGIAMATYVLPIALLRFTQDAKELTSISHTIPFTTPIINMVSNGGGGAFHRLMR